MISSSDVDNRCDSGLSAGIAAASTRLGSTAASRPQRKLCVFDSIAAPFSSIARRIAASDSGSSPRWYA